MRNKSSNKKHISVMNYPIVRNILGKYSVQSTQSGKICKLVTEVGILDSASNVANYLNSYFVNIGSETLQKYGVFANSFIEHVSMRSYNHL